MTLAASRLIAIPLPLFQQLRKGIAKHIRIRRLGDMSVKPGALRSLYVLRLAPPGQRDHHGRVAEVGTDAPA
jgi:hypothetical protein